MFMPRLEYTLINGSMPKVLKNTEKTPLVPSTMIKAKARGTPEKLLIIVFKESKKASNLEGLKACIE